MALGSTGIFPNSVNEVWKRTIKGEEGKKGETREICLYEKIRSDCSIAGEILRNTVPRSTFKWYVKWTQTGLKSETTLKCCSVYMTFYMDISLLQLSKQ